MKAAFLDRDGTIIKDYADAEWRKIKEPEFLSGSIEGVRKLANKGFKIIIITNQYLINDGVISIEDYYVMTYKILKKLKHEGIDILDVFYCPHSRSENCRCCKPKPGMIEAALRKYPDIELSKSILIGDSTADMQLAAAFDISFFGIRGGNLNNDTNLFTSIYDVSERL